MTSQFDPNPQCTIVEASLPFSGVELRQTQHQDDELVLLLEDRESKPLQIVFKQVIGFRGLDERDLTEFWNQYSQPNGWLWEVHGGGWLDLERKRSTFGFDFYGDTLREYFVVSETCINVLTTHAVEIDEGKASTWDDRRL